MQNFTKSTGKHLLRSLFLMQFFRVIERQKVGAKRNFVNRYSAMKRAHLNLILLRYSSVCFCNWIHLRNLSLSVQAGFYYRLHDYSQLVFMRWKFQLGLFKPCENFSSVYRGEIFAYNRNSVIVVAQCARWNLIITV